MSQSIPTSPVASVPVITTHVGLSAEAPRLSLEVFDLPVTRTIIAGTSDCRRALRRRVTLTRSTANIEPAKADYRALRLYTKLWPNEHARGLSFINARSDGPSGLRHSLMMTCVGCPCIGP